MEVTSTSPWWTQLHMLYLYNYVSSRLWWLYIFRIILTPSAAPSEKKKKHLHGLEKKVGHAEERWVHGSLTDHHGSSLARPSGTSLTPACRMHLPQGIDTNDLQFDNETEIIINHNILNLGNLENHDYIYTVYICTYVCDCVCIISVQNNSYTLLESKTRISGASGIWMGRSRGTAMNFDWCA